MNIFENIEYLNKWYFILILFIPILVYYFYKNQTKWFNFWFFKDIKNSFKNSNYKIFIKVSLLLLILFNFIVII